MTADGVLRFPVFRGVRLDLRPEDCTVEAPALGPEGQVRRSRITGPAAVVLPDGTTKGVLCNYYEAMAPVLMPYLRGRMCPPLRADARALWPLPEWTPGWVRTQAVARGKDDELRGVIVEDADTLLFLLEAGAVSLRMTPFREAAPAAADFIALRLDGASAWRVALRTREMVTATGLTAFVKTSGAGSGFDVLVPIGAAPPEAARVLAALFVGLVGRFAESQGVAAEALDAPVAPYAVALPVAPGGSVTVSLPLSWEEPLDEASLAPPLEAVRERFAGSSSDPLRAMLSVAVDFPRAVLALERMVAAGGFG